MDFRESDDLRRARVSLETLVEITKGIREELRMANEQREELAALVIRDAADGTHSK